MGEPLTKEKYLLLSEDERMRARLMAVQDFAAAGVPLTPNLSRALPDVELGASFDADEAMRWKRIHEFAHEVLQQMLREDGDAYPTAAAEQAANRAGITTEEGRQFLRVFSERLAG